MTKLKIDTIFIHIGKCAGTTVRRELGKGGYRFLEIHLARVKFRKDKKFIIVLRNPVARFVSAFNWRYKLVVENGDQANRFRGEKKNLQKYQTANNLAENLYDTHGNLVIDLSKNGFYIHHIREDIHYHIGDFLRNCQKENIEACMAVETLGKDMKKYFNREVTHRMKQNKKDTFLSELAIKNLIQYLQKDYDCIEKVNEMGLLSSEQYQLLSAKTEFNKMGLS